MAGPRILAVEDEDDIRELIRFGLEKEGFSVTAAASGEEALRLAAGSPPDLILLDLMLPGLGGFDVCRALKREPRTAAVPVVMLTARGEDADVVAGLELGAEDYITKPFSPKVLAARIRSVLRRHAPSMEDASNRHASAVLTAGALTLDPSRHEARVDGRVADLTPTEFTLLHFLARHPGWVFTRAQIIDAVKGADYPVTDRSVDVQVVGLRRKLGESGGLIETVHGVGYRFKE
jgi:two-component system, OmpR family, alkaline phosphatase synthesis response regulator PhoP